MRVVTRTDGRVWTAVEHVFDADAADHVARLPAKRVRRQLARVLRDVGPLRDGAPRGDRHRWQWATGGTADYVISRGYLRAFE